MRVSVTLEEPDPLRSVLQFQIEAFLRTGPSDEPSLFDVALHRESRRLAVSGGNCVIDQLLPYYERELKFIRQMAANSRRKYPKMAGRLLLQPRRCEDPHVERLIEAFALLAGRVHHKLDDEFPEITEALLDVLYPHYIRPVPSHGNRAVPARSGPERPGVDPRASPVCPFTASRKMAASARSGPVIPSPFGPCASPVPPCRP